MDVLNEYLKATQDGMHAPRIICNDGFSMSVQASRCHYCHPREDKAFPYSKVEIGFPSRRIPQAHEYAEDSKRHTKTVFGYVPVRIVNEIIDQHGGIKSKQQRATA